MVGALAGTLLSGVLLVTATAWVLEERIGVQERRNRLLERETRVHESRVEQARAWQDRYEQLLERMAVVHRLRNSRPDTVRAFDALVYTLVDGVHYARVERRGRQVEVVGFAASNRLVSALMRNLESSPQFTSARLRRLREDSPGDAGLPGRSVFEMTFVEVVPPAPDIQGTEG